MSWIRSLILCTAWPVVAYACANETRPNEPQLHGAAAAGAAGGSSRAGAPTSGGQNAVEAATGGTGSPVSTASTVGSGGDVTGVAGATSSMVDPPCNPSATVLANSSSAYTLELARAADPDFALSIIIMLPDPGSIAGLTVEQRQAQLAPSQDPIEQLLVQHGATKIERFWLINAFSATLPAKYVLGVPCWPLVQAIESDLNYWEVAARPWDLTSVGTSECPLTNGSCPTHCDAISGQPYYPAQGCNGQTEVLACSIFERGGMIGGNCAASTKAGKIYCDVLNFTLGEPSYLGWRDCTTDEQDGCAQNRGRLCP